MNSISNGPREKHQPSRSSFGAFLMRVREMYLLAKPKNEHHISCLLDSHLPQRGSARNFSKSQSLYRGECSKFSRVPKPLSDVGRKLYTTTCRKSSEFFQVPKPMQRGRSRNISKSKSLYSRGISSYTPCIFSYFQIFPHIPSYFPHVPSYSFIFSSHFPHISHIFFHIQQGDGRERFWSGNHHGIKGAGQTNDALEEQSSEGVRNVIVLERYRRGLVREMGARFGTIVKSDVLYMYRLQLPRARQTLLACFMFLRSFF